MGLSNFLSAAHHASLCQAEGARIIRSLCKEANIGTTFSYSHIEPFREHPADIRAAQKVDTVLNRLFIEPLLGMGYPTKDAPALKKIEKYMKEGDEARLKFDMDFIGLQIYTRELVRHSWFTPYLQARIISAAKRNVPHTQMNWEVYPSAIKEALHRLNKYEGIKKIIVTENGAAFPDVVQGNQIHDEHRKQYIRQHIQQVGIAKQEGVPVEGYFVWTFTDNFEWAEGYRPRFGLVHVDFGTQRRIIKDSGHWYAAFLQQN
jgi:beta-glucosidase